VRLTVKLYLLHPQSVHWQSSHGQDSPLQSGHSHALQPHSAFAVAANALGAAAAAVQVRPLARIASTGPMKDRFIASFLYLKWGNRIGKLADCKLADSNYPHAVKGLKRRPLKGPSESLGIASGLSSERIIGE
jgi:hypothetical protein